jgi:putative tryptophan/tyrosine transport system substrate-binding protein
MRRREFIAGIAGSGLAWSVAAQAQQAALPVVGYVRSTTARGFANLEAALRQGLTDAGFVEGQNVAIEFHYADNRTDRLSVLIDELIRRPVAVIVANQIAAIAAKAATTTVPIVFAIGGDPLQDGLVASLSRPGGNVTGVSFLTTTLGAKRLELLHQLAPQATTIAALVHGGSPQAEAERSDLPAAAQAMGLRLLILDVGSANEIDTAVATVVQNGAGALFVGGGGFLNSQRDRLVALAARQKLPASFIVRETVFTGGLMSYGPSQTDAYRQAGAYVARILNGEKPANLPVMQSTKFEFVLNLRTAKALGLAISPTLLALADEVIE